MYFSTTPGKNYGINTVSRCSLRFFLFPMHFYSKNHLQWIVIIKNHFQCIFLLPLAKIMELTLLEDVHHVFVFLFPMHFHCKNHLQWIFIEKPFPMYFSTTPGKHYGYSTLGCSLSLGAQYIFVVKLICNEFFIVKTTYNAFFFYPRQ